LDAIAARTLRLVLETYVKRGSIVFLTSHILDIVERLCTHVGIINEGTLVTQCSLAELVQTGSLESAFIKAVGDIDAPPSSLSWLSETV
jgi:ABC-2 type transport system ATP-binding protein